LSWNDNDLSDSQYGRALNFWQNRDGMEDINREIKRMRKCKKTSKKKPQKEKGFLSKVAGFFRGRG
jgi:hypothetical protein|tara:strand:- start:675 stop:872 length:198 start_codon:yes stop_codon:yes gene_type:complete